MSDIGPDTVLLVFLMFCRIGGCLMLMPGYSSSRVPVQVRLFLAVAVTLALSPVVLPGLRVAVPDLANERLVLLIVSESTIGLLIGLLGRIFFQALQFMATAAAMFIGLTTVSGPAVEDAEPTPAFATLVTLTATLLFFLTDQHWEVLRALLASYAALPVSEPLALDFSVGKIAEASSQAFLLALQITSPFIVYALIANFLVGIANKLTPQVPIYFVSVPAVMAGGLFILYFTIGETLRMFMLSFAGWLTRG